MSLMSPVLAGTFLSAVTHMNGFNTESHLEKQHRTVDPMERVTNLVGQRIPQLAAWKHVLVHRARRGTGTKRELQTAFNPKRCIQGDFSNDRWKITKREKGLSVMAASLDAGLSEEEISFSASVKEDNKNLLLRHS
ncbi:hypothetical protein MG293_000933 [Ovis ammon polii]|uniref:Uncharacterized protein n=1 Tax=Ovis ammon polii TaxID=230172 RepID=A0AAD4ULM8_OVIAM|nr:hypothetical protein MG293_000933 [Ovis ammon polii]